MTSTPCSPIPEPVANARLCRHEARACRLRLHFPPQVADVDAQKVDFAVVPFAPDLPQKLLVGDDLAGVAHQNAQEIVFRWRELDLFRTPRHSPPRKIDGEVAKRENGRPCRLHSTPQSSP